MSNTDNLDLKLVPQTNKNTTTFNTEEMLNANWRKIDLFAKAVEEKLSSTEDLEQDVSNLIQDIGNLPGLETETKLNLVAAVNEIYQKLIVHQADDVNHVKYAVDTGTANAKVVTFNPAPTEYVDGMALTFKNSIQNTGAVTINVNDLGAKSILKSNGSALASGNLKAGIPYTLRYNGTSFILQGEGGEYGNATASQVLAPNTFGTENGIVTGTMPNRGTFNLALGATVPAGYYSGGTVPNGKRMITGVVDGVSFGNTRTVTGLPFNPKYVQVWFEWSTYKGEGIGVLSNVGFGLRTNNINININAISGNSFTFYFGVDVSNAWANWIAIE